MASYEDVPAPARSIGDDRIDEAIASDTLHEFFELSLVPYSWVVIRGTQIIDWHRDDRETGRADRSGGYFCTDLLSAARSHGKEGERNMTPSFICRKTWHG